MSPSHRTMLFQWILYCCGPGGAILCSKEENMLSAKGKYPRLEQIHPNQAQIYIHMIDNYSILDKL